MQVTLHDPHGHRQTIRARYLVAADGAHSPIRRMLGVEMREWDGAYGGTQVLFRAPLARLLGGVRYALYAVTTAAAPGLFLPAGRGDRWIYGPADVDHPPDLDATHLTEQIRIGAGFAELQPRIERIGPFHSPGQMAVRFRAGRTFLVGDAAHRVTPRGGTGLNTALQSGYDLGWKLSWALRGWAPPELLDTYEVERRVVAEHNIVRSTDPQGSRRPVLDELSVDLGGRLRHAWLPAESGRVSTLDLLGPGWTLFTGPSGDGWTSAARSAAAPVTIRALDAMTARTIGVHGDGALLARPDGVPSALWTSAAGAADLRGTVASAWWTSSAPSCARTRPSTSPRPVAALVNRGRIEIWMLDIDGRFFITGTPGRRDWLANLMAEPRSTVHLKQLAHLDLSARGHRRGRADPSTSPRAPHRALVPIANARRRARGIRTDGRGDARAARLRHSGQRRHAREVNAVRRRSVPDTRGRGGSSRRGPTACGPQHPGSVAAPARTVGRSHRRDRIVRPGAAG